jgi:hypothetical protein
LNDCALHPIGIVTGGRVVDEVHFNGPAAMITFENALHSRQG